VEVPGAENNTATLKRMWANGGRGLLIVGAVAVLVLVLNVITMLWLYWPDSDFEPMYGTGFDAPQEVTQTTIKVGQPINVTGVTKCNSSDRLVSSAGTLHWKRLEPSITYVPGFSGAATTRLPHECVTQSFENAMPADVGPGVWQLTGQELVYFGGQLVQTLTWETQSFTVTE